MSLLYNLHELLLLPAAWIVLTDVAADDSSADQPVLVLLPQQHLLHDLHAGDCLLVLAQIFGMLHLVANLSAKHHSRRQTRH